ncbi:DUF2357 domain-containing protein [Segnochrobactraceae bacterium EtOH-i3]
MASAFLLTRPWGLYTTGPDTPGAEPERHVLEPGARLALSAGCGFWVAAPETTRVSFAGRRTAEAQMEGGGFVWGAPFRMLTLPVGSVAREAEFRVRSGDGETLIALSDPPVRPDQPDDTPAGVLLAMLLSLIGRLRALSDDADDTGAVEHQAVGRKLIGTVVPWRTAEDRWCQTYQTAEPPLDLIVRQAEELQTLTEELAAHPRRVLTRVRTLQPVARLQEMDAACIDWYVRQPGRDTRERAGTRQRLLGVARVESHDTLENRILRQYLDLARDEADRYRALHRSLREGERLRRVGRFARSCRHLAREMAADGVGLPVLPVTPNFVLQSDRRYRRIWEAWRALMKREREKDDVWRWQTRMWAEFCRLTVLVALRRIAGTTIVAEAPLRVKADQEHGRWVDLAAHPAVFHVVCHGLNAAVTVIDAQSAEAADYRGGLGQGRGKAFWQMIWSLGAVAVLHAQDLVTDAESWTVIWALHPLVPGHVDLAGEVIRADGALDRAARQFELTEGHAPRLAGLILLSAPPAAPGAGEEQPASTGVVLGYRCAVDGASLGQVVEGLADLLPVALGAA